MKLLEKIFIYSMIVIGVALYQIAKRFSDFGIYLHGNRVLPMTENDS